MVPSMKIIVRATGRLNKDPMLVSCPDEKTQLPG